MLKRVVPFILTFVLGLAIASIFVNIAPGFKVERGDKHRNHHEIISELELDNDQLRKENRCLKNKAVKEVDEFVFEDAVPPPMPIEPRRNR
jgi:hypothetical protein